MNSRYDKPMDRQFTIEAVIFDMDGLMFDTERLSYEALKTAASDYGYDLLHETYMETVGRNAWETEKILFRSFGDSFPFSRIWQRKQQCLHNQIVSDGIPLKPGLLELLVFMDGLAWKKGVASSTARDLVMPT